MATVQAQMLSGRYRTEALCSHWSKNKKGVCLLSSECGNTIEDLPHILSFCPSLTPARTKLNHYTLQYSSNLPDGIKKILMQHCSPSSSTFINFLLDCTSLPDVISAVQVLDADVLHHLFNISRTWVYVLHRERLKQLGRWNLFWTGIINTTAKSKTTISVCCTWKSMCARAQLRSGALAKIPPSHVGCCGCYKYVRISKSCHGCFLTNKERKKGWVVAKRKMTNQ